MFLVFLAAPSLTAMAIGHMLGYTSVGSMLIAAVAGQVSIFVSPLLWLLVEANAFAFAAGSAAYLWYAAQGVNKFSWLFLVGAAGLVGSLIRSSSVASSGSVSDWPFNKMNANGQLGPSSGGQVERDYQN